MDDALAIELLRRDPSAVDDREREQCHSGLHHRRQVHDHGVLSDDAQVEQPAVAPVNDASDRERVREPESQAFSARIRSVISGVCPRSTPRSGVNSASMSYVRTS